MANELIYESFPEKVNANIDQRQKYILSYDTQSEMATAEFVSANWDEEGDCVLLLVDKKRMFETDWNDELVCDLMETPAGEYGVLIAKTKTVNRF